MSNKTQSKPAQFTLDITSAAIRESTWQTICTHNAHISWPPHLIDEVLNETTAQGVQFDELCRIAAEAPVRKFPPTRSVTAEALSEAPNDPLRTLLTPFLQRLGRKITSGMSIAPNHQLRDEIQELVTDNYVRTAVRFQPSGEKHGDLVTYGYEAYQMVQSQGVTRHVARIFRMQTAISLNAEQEAAGHEPSYSTPMEATPEQRDLRVYLVEALRAALDEPIAWKMIHSIAYLDCTQGEVARDLGLNRKTFSGAVATQIKNKLQHKLADVFNLEEGKSASVAQIAKCIAGVFDEAEFIKLIPAPTGAQVVIQSAVELPARFASDHTVHQEVDQDMD